MYDGMFGTSDAFKGASNQIFAALHENLDGYVARDQIIFDQVAAEIKISLAGGRKTDLNFLKTHFDERIPHADFAVGAHGFDEALVAIAQIDAAPDGGRGDLSGRPFAVGQVNWREGAVFLGGIDHHDIYVSFCLLKGVSGLFPCRAWANAQKALRG